MKSLQRGVFFALVALYVAVIATKYISIEHNVYYWDTNGYWKLWQNFSRLLFNNPADALSTLSQSMRVDDYNMLPAAILSLINYFQWDGRLPYILSVFFLYFIPCAVLFSLLSAKISGAKDYYIYVLSVAVFVSSPPFWAPTLRGYPDIGGLIFIIGAVIYCIKTDFTQKIRLKEAIFLGFLLWGAFLMRRWYAYTVVSLCLSLPILNYVLNTTYASNNYKALKNIVINALASGLGMTLFMITFQFPLISRILMTDYSEIYSGYQGQIQVSLHNLVNNFGLALFPVLLFCTLIIIWKPSKRQLSFLAFSLFNLIFSFILFCRTQSPAVHHLLPFSLWILLITVQGTFIFLSIPKSTIVKSLILFFIFTGSSLVLVNTLFSPSSLAWLDKIGPHKTLPLRVENKDEYLALIDEIFTLTAQGESVGVLSSGTELNDDMLSTMSDRELDKYLVPVAHVDLRDGINFYAIDARYVVVTTPTQIHLAPDYQRVITIPVESILSRKNIGNAYEKFSREYRLSETTSAWIYVKKRQFTYSEVRRFLDSHYEYYPDWKSRYNSDFIAAYFAATSEEGDVWGAFSLASDGTAFAHPGETTPTNVSWSFNSTKALHIKSVNTSCNLDDPILVYAGLPGRDVHSYELEKGKSINLNIESFQNKEWVLSISKKESVYCSSVSISPIQ